MRLQRERWKSRWESDLQSLGMRNDNHHLNSLSLHLIPPHSNLLVEMEREIHQQEVRGGHPLRSKSGGGSS